MQGLEIRADSMRDTPIFICDFAVCTTRYPKRLEVHKRVELYPGPAMYILKLNAIYSGGEQIGL